MAVESIQMAGGIAGWAHPLGGEGERHLTATEFENRLHLLLAAGVQALEYYYSKYTLEEVSFLVEQAEKHGLLISGGSDYHGTISMYGGVRRKDGARDRRCQRNRELCRCGLRRT